MNTPPAQEKIELARKKYDAMAKHADDALAEALKLACRYCKGDCQAMVGDFVPWEYIDNCDLRGAIDDVANRFLDAGEQLGILTAMEKAAGINDWAETEGKTEGITEIEDKTKHKTEGITEIEDKTKHKTEN